jgi:hypothetical protein
MDNRETIPGYKIYVDPETGEQPLVHVAYLGIRSDPHAHVSGVALEVTPGELARLDRRERNYDRRDIGDLADADVDGPVWAYVGRPGPRWCPPDTSTASGRASRRSACSTTSRRRPTRSTCRSSRYSGVT